MKIKKFWPERAQEIWYAYLNWVKKERGYQEWEKRKFDPRLEPNLNLSKKDWKDEWIIGVQLHPYQEEIRELFEQGFQVVEDDDFLYQFEKFEKKEKRG